MHGSTTVFLQQNTELVSVQFASDEVIKLNLTVPQLATSADNVTIIDNNSVYHFVFFLTSWNLHAHSIFTLIALPVCIYFNIFSVPPKCNMSA